MCNLQVPDFAAMIRPSTLHTISTFATLSSAPVLVLAYTQGCANYGVLVLANAVEFRRELVEYGYPLIRYT